METFLFFRSASSETWETIADVGSWMVIAGVVGEGLEISIKLLQLLRPKWKRFWDWLSQCTALKVLRCKCAICLEWFDKHELALEVWGGFWWLIVVLGLVIEVGANQRARKIDGAENVQLHMRAASLETNAADLNFKTEELRKARLELEAELQWRRINPEQKTNLVALLKPFRMSRPMYRDVVEVLASPMDGEALSYAEQLTDILRECGFEVRFVPGLQTGGSRNGVGLFVGNAERPPQHSPIILAAFKTAGMHPQGLSPWPWPEALGTDVLLVFVSQKP